MFAQLFNRQPLLDSGTQLWIFDTFAWALKNFDAEFFYRHSELILPSNEFYPGRVNSIEEMSDSVFSKTLAYAGLHAWPIKLYQPAQFNPQPVPQLTFNAPSVRGDLVEIAEKGSTEIAVSFNPSQINQPQDLIASYVQAMASILIQQRGLEPPGGAEYFQPAVDLMGCFMGFGVILTNTAYQFKGGCGSCNNPRANRQVALPETETLYCLALFCRLKGIVSKAVLPHIKSHLRSQFKRAYKELEPSRFEHEIWQLIK